MNSYKSRFIKQAVTQKNIPFLTHFTPVGNLESIMKCGLLSREKVDELGIHYTSTDDLRLDERTYTVSTSIAFPNDLMFGKKRNAMWRNYFAVLIIEPSVLWERDAVFCRTNAANRRVRDMDTGWLMGGTAFNNMFYESEYRSQEELLDCDPTDSQAEVLVVDSIDTSHIRAVVFDHEKTHDKYQPMLEKKGIHSIFSDVLFDDRSNVRKNRKNDYRMLCDLAKQIAA